MTEIIEKTNKFVCSVGFLAVGLVLSTQCDLKNK